MAGPVAERGSFCPPDGVLEATASWNAGISGTADRQATASDTRTSWQHRGGNHWRRVLGKPEVVQPARGRQRFYDSAGGLPCAALKVYGPDGLWSGNAD